MAKGRKTGGRQPGSPNKTTAAVKELIEGALSDLGGKKWLVKAAKKQPGAFMNLISKLIPRDLNVSGEVKHTLEQLVMQSMRKDDHPGDKPH